MTGDQAVLRRVLAELTDEVTVVDMRRRVATARAKQRRRRQAVTAVALASAVLVTVGAVRASRTEQTLPSGVTKIVDLSSAPLGQVKRPRVVIFEQAALLSADSWAIGAAGRAVRHQRDRMTPQGPAWPRLSADGRTVIQVSEFASQVTGRWDSRIHLQTGAGAPRAIDHELFGAPISRYATLSPDGSTVAVLGTPNRHQGYGGGLQLVDVAEGTSRNIGLSEMFQRPVGEFSRDGRRFTFLSVTGGLAGYVDLATGHRGPVRSFAGMTGTTREPGGFAVSPDGSRVAVPVPLFPGGGWSIMSVLTGAKSEPFMRRDERLLAWTDDGHLIWGRLTNLGRVYSIRATDLNGRNARLLYRINLGYDGTQSTVLIARDLDVPQ